MPSLLSESNRTPISIPADGDAKAAAALIEQSAQSMHSPLGVPATVGTKVAAQLLGRSVQCLHLWSSASSGPLRPVRLNGRGSPLRWRLSDIAALLNGEEAR